MNHNNWQSLKWGDLATLEYGKALRAYKKNEAGEYPVYGTNGQIGWHSKSLYDKPGIIIGRKGAYRGVHYSHSPFFVIDTAFYLKPKDNIQLDIKWAYYQLRNFDINTIDSGSAIPSTSREAFYQIPVLLTPLPIQRKIAAILSAYDDLIENNLRRIGILEEMAQAIYREWFVKFRFPGHEGIRMVDSPLGKIPEGWEVRKSSECMLINPHLSVDKKAKKPFIGMEGLSTNSMLANISTYRTGSSGAKFQNGDTLFARITPCLENGKTGFVQCLPDADTIAIGSTEFIVLRTKTLCPEYVYLLARNEEFRNNAIKSMSGATGRQRVRVECFDDYMLAEPDETILEKFSNIVRTMFLSIHQLAAKNQNLRRTRDLLLPKLISGQLDVSELDIAMGENQ